MAELAEVASAFDGQSSDDASVAVIGFMFCLALFLGFMSLGVFVRVIVLSGHWLGYCFLSRDRKSVV